MPKEALLRVQEEGKSTSDDVLCTVGLVALLVPGKLILYPSFSYPNSTQFRHQATFSYCSPASSKYSLMKELFTVCIDFKSIH